MKNLNLAKGKYVYFDRIICSSSLIFGTYSHFSLLKQLRLTHVLISPIDFFEYKSIWWNLHVKFRNSSANQNKMIENKYMQHSMRCFEAFLLQTKWKVFSFGDCYIQTCQLIFFMNSQCTSDAT